ncbi:MAG: carbamoyl phosphate synthase large subunit [Candidatus Melainabacteria bacterium RIFCSPHIGHO2_02_FULL_34_12]|nr:MAG: carbamoyl phosphate synthase large subunit [Candidatus Melainabacteria bacterium RIFCSPHIGHO2_02_FULL_34_12]
MKRKDIKKILIVGAGPIVIGQACEFDYSGTQACRALKEEGYEVILVNSNPATIMTDPEFADRTYIEPITPEFVRAIIEKERPDALLPTMGGQTSLNIAVQLAKNGILKEYNVELIGAKLPAIELAEDRELFKNKMQEIGLEVPKSYIAKSKSDGIYLANEIGYPVILRPAFTLGGTGGGIAYNQDELEAMLDKALEMSPIHQVLLEESVAGWKEFELEVMRDLKDNVVIICSIENLDPMGIHTGDSITVAPAQTLTDKEYQYLRDASIKIIRAIGVETGGSNIQFAVNPRDGKVVVIEMNPRVSRSSALASKATGFPIAKIAAKLAVGYTLDEIPNDITRTTYASFEPTIDYVVTKIPRFAQEKFPGADHTLTTQMKSVGEVMAIGRTFKESFQKALRGLEIKMTGFYDKTFLNESKDSILSKLKTPSPDRVKQLYAAFYKNISINEIYSATAIDPWFLKHLEEIVFEIKDLEGKKLNILDNKEKLFNLKSMGFSDKQLALIFSISTLKSKSNENISEKDIRKLREKHNIFPVFKTVDTCASEFEAYTPYYYSTYESESEVRPSSKKKVMILGGGPNRIGQGIEFDYCCVHAVFGLREEGFETIMVNSNPETVSTDYNISDRLYFEPLTAEDVFNIYNLEKPEGVIVQFGGQTPLNIAKALEDLGVKIAGTQPDSIQLAEDRKLFSEIIKELGLNQPKSESANSVSESIEIAKELGFPLLVRPSFVLGGRAMEIFYSLSEMEKFIENVFNVEPEHPVLIDTFLENATEVDVDAICDGKEVIICGVMEHIEEAGVHSGDSACILPPQNISEKLLSEIKNATIKLALKLKVIGLMNIQYAIKDDILYVLEVNPRASRTIPFVSKATGIPWAKMASKIMLGKNISELKLKEVIPKWISVKEVVLPFHKFPGSDIILGPEMKSTGEVMGISDEFSKSYAKSQLAANQLLPVRGNIFISVNDKDKKGIVAVAKELSELGLGIYSTSGTAKVLSENGIKVKEVQKVYEGRPNIVDHIKNKEVQLIINTPIGREARQDDKYIRQAAIQYSIPVVTTVRGAKATVLAIKSMKSGLIEVKPLQEYYSVAQHCK